MSDYLSLDFEFRDSGSERHYEVVCACTQTKTEAYQWWLNEGDHQPFLDYFRQKAVQEGLPVNCHYAHAEVTCLLSLGVDLDNVNFIDTFVEAKLVQNTDDRRKPKYLSLADLAKYFDLFDYYADDYKDRMRKLIVHHREYTQEQKQQILNYCSTDTSVSHTLLPKIMQWHKDVFGQYPKKNNIYTRGNYIKSSAYASWVGIKLCPDKLKAIEQNHIRLSNTFVEEASQNVRDCYVQKGLYYSLNRHALAAKIEELGLTKKWKLTDTGQYTTSSDDLKEMQNYHPFIAELRQVIKRISSLAYLKPRHTRAIDFSQYEEIPHWSHIISNPDFFTKSGTIQKRNFANYLQNQNLDWETNEKGNYVTSKDAFDRYYSFAQSHDDKLLSLYKDVQIIKLWKDRTKQELNGDEEDEAVAEQSTLHTETTENGSLHIPYGPFGTTTGRNAPKARLFIFAQAAWQRSLVDVPKGHALVAVDYASAEILIGSQVYGDSKMYEAFTTTDYYLTSGASMGVIPAEDYNNLSMAELKQKYSKTRTMLKSLVLGLNYGMGATKLGRNLFPEESEFKAVRKAKQLISKYKKVYSEFFKNSRKYVDRSGHPTLWGHWGHAGLSSGTTAGNFYIQATGALILHKAMNKLSRRSVWKQGIYLCCPLHDAIYFYAKNDSHLQSRINTILSNMADAKKEALNSDVGVKMEYKICHAGETFFEKDEDNVRRVHELIGHDYKLMDTTEHSITI